MKQRILLAVVAAAVSGGIHGIQCSAAAAPAKAKIAYLGVVTSPVRPEVAVHVPLPRGAGLVIDHVAPDSPAAAVLQQYDILYRIDDQYLYNHAQLAALIRHIKPGTDVTLGLLRQGKDLTTQVTLGERQAPEPGDEDIGGALGGVTVPWMRSFRFGDRIPQKYEESWRKALEKARQQLDSLLDETEKEDKTPTQDLGPAMEELAESDGQVSVSVQTDAQSSGSYSIADGTGTSATLSVNGGHKRLTVKDHGKEVFNGPVDTEAERQAVPEKYRGQLDKLEEMSTGAIHIDRQIRVPEPPPPAAPGQPL